MSRVTIVDPTSARAEAAPLLDAARARSGAVPNFVRVLANAPAALEGFLGLYAIAGKGALDAWTRERIALALAERNGCQYCVSAHAALAAGAGLGDAESQAARHGTSSGTKAAVAVGFARALVDSMGEVSKAEWDAARGALTEEEAIEVIAHVALNLFTNILGKATQVPIASPEARPLEAA